jgi:hypothetical protein
MSQDVAGFKFFGGSDDFIMQNVYLLQLFCTYGVNIFIDYRPACLDTEKGGKGERDTGMITRNGVTSCVARGYLRSCNPRRQRGTDKGPLPPASLSHLGQLSTASLDLEDCL